MVNISLPLYSMNKILKDRAVELNKCARVHSMWNYDKDNNTITIYTDRPGFWIGYHGRDIDEIQRKLDLEITKYNKNNSGFLLPYVNVKLVECNY